MSHEAPIRVRDALVDGELSSEDLTARRLGRFLGKTTSVLYHHWGSVDGFLFAVSRAGFTLLRERLARTMEEGTLEDLAATFVGFGLDAPDLYEVMLERRFDWEALSESGAFEDERPGMELWRQLAELLAENGSANPVEDGRLVFAGLHGLVSLAISGRANIGDLSKSDREVAISSARRLVRQMAADL